MLCLEFLYRKRSLHMQLHLLARAFIVFASLLLTLTLGGKTSAREPIPLGQPPSYEDFKAYLGETFWAYGGGVGLTKAVTLRLIAVSERQRDAYTERFFVRFRGPGDPVLPKNVLTIEHAQSGKFLLFLEPDGNDAQGRYYRADFNLLQNTTSSTLPHPKENH